MNNESADGIEQGKIFVGGLSWETTKESLKAYFDAYGEVTDCVIMEDAATKNPRGFGFVTFKDPESVLAVINQKTAHMLDKKKIDPKQATLKGGTNIKCKKIFVGGLSFDTTAEDLNAHFSTFGTVIDSEIKKDRDTDKRRGFGFVDFDSEEAVDRACAMQYQIIKGKSVEVKKAEPQKKDKRLNTNQGYPGFHYPTPAGRGGFGQAHTSYHYSYPQGQHGYHPNFAGYSSPPNYSQPGGQYYQPTDYSGLQANYGRGFGGQQHPQMSSYPHESSYSQPRSGYGQAGDNYASGSSYFDHHGSYNYTPDTLGSGGGSAYGRGSSQRSSYSYGGR